METHHALKSPSKETEVTFGSVTVRVSQPDAESIRQNIKEGQDALTRVHSVLVKPGVRLSAPKGTPIFFAIPDRLDVIIREIDGVRTTGRFIDGRFRKINEKENAALGRNSSKSSPRSRSLLKKA